MDEIALIGVGKLGLCFALNLERSGFKVWGIETNAEYARALQDRSFFSSEPEVNNLLQNANDFHVETTLNCIVNHEIKDIFLMVATPSTADGGYNHSQIERVAEKLMEIGSMETPRHVYIGCTTMPGYCGTLAKKLEPFGYSVSYNPEFIAQGSIIHDQLKPDQVLIGQANEQVGNRIQGIYEKLTTNHPQFCRMDTLSAEIAKLATNCFLTTKISFANSLGDLARISGANEGAILKAIGADSRIGPKYLGYGFGYGGPCFPRDNRALDKFAESMGYPLLISKATDQVNQTHFQYMLNEYLNGYEPQVEIVFNGVTYKKGTSLITESQQLRLAVALAEAGRKVRIRDIEEVIKQVQQIYPAMFQLEITHP